MSALPAFVAFNCHVLTGDFRSAAVLLAQLLADRRLGAVERWSTVNANGKANVMARALQKLPDTADELGDEPVFLMIETKHIVANLKLTVDGGTAFTSVNLTRAWTKSDKTRDWLAFQNACLAIACAFFGRYRIHSADLQSTGAGCACIPDVPLVDGHSHIIVTNRDEVLQLYDDPDTFWRAGWNRCVSTSLRQLSREITEQRPPASRSDRDQIRSGQIDPA